MMLFLIPFILTIVTFIHGIINLNTRKTLILTIINLIMSILGAFLFYDPNHDEGSVGVGALILMYLINVLIVIFVYALLKSLKNKREGELKWFKPLVAFFCFIICLLGIPLIITTIETNLILAVKPKIIRSDLTNDISFLNNYSDIRAMEIRSKQNNIEKENRKICGNLSTRLYKKLGQTITILSINDDFYNEDYDEFVFKALFNDSEKRFGNIIKNSNKYKYGCVYGTIKEVSKNQHNYDGYEYYSISIIPEYIELKEIETGEEEEY